MNSNRYIFDALYGPVRFPDYVWAAALCPEFQRLREVRMCNINSLCLTGGANINRYEHCLGVAHLALHCIEDWPLRPSEDEIRLIVLAALLHDIGSTAFGHSVQYVLDRNGFQHESFLDILLGHDGKLSPNFSYQHTLTEPIYFGVPRRLHTLIPTQELQVINDMVEGRGPYGALISGSMDLDNIDNVYRLAYHIGLVNSGKTPLQLSRSLVFVDGHFCITRDGDDLVRDWYHVRRRLYEYLLLNPDEFSAKCMLQEALENAQQREPQAFRWNDVDFELLEKLARCSDETSSIVSRLAIGDLYGCVGIYCSPAVDICTTLENAEYRRELEIALSKRARAIGVRHLKSALVRLHVIRDVNKTQRQITFRRTDGSILTVGSPTRRVLIGVFFKNVHLSMAALRDRFLFDNNLPEVMESALKELMPDPQLTRMEQYSELTP